MKCDKLLLLLSLLAASVGRSDVFQAPAPRAASLASATSASAAADSTLLSFSSDGRWVVFLSAAKNLATNELAGPFLNLYARDLQTGSTLLVTTSSDGNSAANGDTFAASISGDGRWVAFESAANNLVSNDTNGVNDIFLRDLVLGTTILVSANPAGASANGASMNPVITLDGRWIAFETAASDLVPDDMNGIRDVFLYDRQSGITTLVSVGARKSSPPSSSNPSKSESPAITPDGQRVLFVSSATNLINDAGATNAEIYARDVTGGRTQWVSTNAFTLLSNKAYRCFAPVISTNGRFAAFKFKRPSDTLASLAYHDLETEMTTLVASDTSLDGAPQLSADGRLLAYDNAAGVFVWHADSSSNQLVSVGVDGASATPARFAAPVLSADGHTVVFLSSATNLVTNAPGLGFQLFARDLTTDQTALVSVNFVGNGADSDFESTVPLTSGDGRWVAFEGLADDLIADDLNQATDIFVRDLMGGNTQLVSRRHSIRPAMTRALASGAWSGSVSASGRFTAMTSLSTNLDLLYAKGPHNVVVFDSENGQAKPVTETTFDPTSFGGCWHNGIRDVQISSDGQFVTFTTFRSFFLGTGWQFYFSWLDQQTGTTLCLAYTGLVPASQASSLPWTSMSSDGRLVALTSGGTLNQILLADTLLNTNELISVSYLGGGEGDNESIAPRFSPDANLVLFVSLASDLLETNLPPTTSFRLFARNRALQQTRLLSLDENGAVLGGAAGGTTFSADGHFAAFHAARGTNDTNTAAFRCDLTVNMGANLLIAANGANVSLSADGMLAAYEARLTANQPLNVFLKDLRTGGMTLISRSRDSEAGGNGDSTTPLVSGDGRFVVFASKAGNLVPNDANNVSDIFVRDVRLGATLLLSLNRQGNGSGNGPSSKPVLGPDGRTVVFQSFASDLVEGDYNDRRDVFLVTLGGIDSDHDGLDDDWEMAYFGNLAHDGTADSDGDGQTDLQEFLAGTDPTNGGSIFQVLSVSVVGGNQVRVLWVAAPGRTYRVEYKDDAEAAAWQSLPGLITAAGSTASALDAFPNGPGHRFYRAVLLP